MSCKNQDTSGHSYNLPVSFEKCLKVRNFQWSEALRNVLIENQCEENHTFSQQQLQLQTKYFLAPQTMQVSVVAVAMGGVARMQRMPPAMKYTRLHTHTQWQG